MSHAKTSSPLAFLTGGGEVGALMRATDWSLTALGDPAAWPAELRTVVGVMLGSRQPMFTVWGPERTILYNDGFAAISGDRHPASLGRPFEEFWPDVRPVVEPILERACAGKAPHGDDIELTMHRRGDPQETRFAFSHSPVTLADGSIGGLFCAGTGTAGRVPSDRRPHEGEARLRALVNASSDIVYRMSPDWIEMRQLDGRGFIADTEAPSVRWIDEYIFPQDRAQVLAVIEEAVRSKGVFELEHRVRRVDGTAGWTFSRAVPVMDGDGEIVEWFGMAGDVTGRREAEDRLRENAERHGALVSASSEVLYSHNSDWSEMSALSGGNFLADTTTADPDWFGKYIPIEEQARVRAAIDQAIATKGIFELEHRVRQADGEIGWTFSRSVPLLNERGEIREWFGAAADVTERRNAEEALRASEERVRKLNETLASQIAERTAERDRAWRLAQELLAVAGSNGTIEAVNEAWIRLLGWREGDLVGKPFVDLIHPDDVAPTLKAFTGIFDAPLVEPYECRLRHRDGTYRCFAWTAAFEEGKVYASGRDVTQEREREAALRDFEDFARLALTSVGGVGVWTYDVASDRFTCDAAIADLYGLDVERATHGIDRAEFLSNVHPDDMPKLRATMSGGLKQAGDLELEYRLRHPGGAIRWVLSRGHTYFDEAGKPVRRTGVGIETTKQRQLEEALRQSQKMEAVGQLTGGLAHDFNNLLAGISGSLEMMQSRIAQGRLSEVDRYMTGAQGAAKRAAALTHRLLAFSRRQTLDPKPTDINRLVAGMEDLIRRTVGPAIAIETVAGDGLWSTLVDPPQLENALLNLCINARDAMPDGGKLTIETGNRRLDDRAALERDLPPGQYISMCVCDNGSGMPPDVVERAFDPFFTTKPIGVGTGLGLSMIYGFARQSGGQVRIDSEVGQGTTVCLYLPRHHVEEEAAAAAPAPSAIESAGSGETVLVIDDEPLVRMLVVDVLEDLGYIAIEAGDGPQGLKVLRSDVRLDLLITDVGLPNGMNGRQVADAARDLRPNLKVMFVTGYAENAVLGHGHLMPGMQVVTKPFDMRMLATRIKAMMDQTLS